MTTRMVSGNKGRIKQIGGLSLEWVINNANINDSIIIVYLHFFMASDMKLLF